MSEAQKSAMGPRRLFILLALGAVVFYFLSSDGEAEESEEIVSKNEAVEDLDLGDDSTTLTLQDEFTFIPVKEDTPPQAIKEDEEYTPQSQGREEEHNPQSGGGSSDYQPQYL